MYTDAPARVSGSGKPEALEVELARPAPKIVASDPGDTRGAKLAASVTAWTTEAAFDAATGMRNKGMSRKRFNYD
jgi:hypothetical protein